MIMIGGKAKDRVFLSVESAQITHCIAEGMGAVGITVKKTGEMRPALQEAQRLNADGKTVLIDVHTSMESKQSRF